MTILTVSVPGWDAGARSIATLEGDGAFSFVVGQATAIVCGLTHADVGAGYREIEHGFYVESGVYRVIERGEQKTGAHSRRPDAEFEIRREGETVTYRVDGTLVYTSSVRSFGPVFLDCSLYAYGDEIRSIWMTTAGDAHAAVALPPLVAFGVDGDLGDVNFAAINLLPLTVAIDLSELHVGLLPLTVAASIAGDEWIDAAAAAELSPLIALGIDAALGDVNYALAQLSPLAAQGEVDGLVPDITYAHAWLSPLAVGLIADDELFGPVSAIIEIEPLVALGIDGDLGPDFVAGHAPLAPLDAWMVEGFSTYARLQWPRFALRSPWNFSLYATPRAPVARINATAHRFSVRASPRVPTARIGTGATIRAQPRLPTATMAVTVPTLVRLLAAPRIPVARISALVGSVLSIRASPRLPVARIFTGATVRARPRVPVARIAVSVPIIARVFANPARPVARISALVGSVLSIRASPRIPTARIGRGNAIFAQPRVPTARITLRMVVNVDSTTTCAVNLTTGAVTEWVLAPTKKLATAHGLLYGLLDDGTLIVFDADDDRGEGIGVTLRFGQNDFGDIRAKRMSELYFTVRENDGIIVHCIPDEIALHSYSASPTRAHGRHRVNVGKGMVFHSMGLIVQNQGGGDLDLGAIDANWWPTQRKIR